jgi:hypothetical protein
VTTEAGPSDGPWGQAFGVGNQSWIEVVFHVTPCDHSSQECNVLRTKAPTAFDFSSAAHDLVEKNALTSRSKTFGVSSSADFRMR